MAYAIMRAKKLATMGSVASALQHCYRERETPNADPTRTVSNEHHAAQTTDEAMGKLREQLPEKRRKDAVLAIEYVMTASPEWWNTATPEQQNEFFARSKQWLSEKYGSERIITATIHRDEATPHLSAFVVPLTKEGRLSAKEFIGNRQKMTQDQTTFAQTVHHLGLERGIQGSRATHQRVKSHYAALEKADRTTIEIKPEEVKPRVLRKGIFTQHLEDPQMIAARLTSAVNQAFRPLAEKAAIAAQSRRKLKAIGKQLEIEKNRSEAVLRAFKGLSREQVTEILNTALDMQKKNLEAKRKKPEQEHQKGWSR